MKDQRNKDMQDIRDFDSTVFTSLRNINKQAAQQILETKKMLSHETSLEPQVETNVSKFLLNMDD